jgi:hypothetical protein
VGQAALAEGLRLLAGDDQLKHIVGRLSRHHLSHFGHVEQQLDHAIAVFLLGIPRLEIDSPHVDIAELEEDRLCPLARRRAGHVAAPKVQLCGRRLILWEMSPEEGGESAGQSHDTGAARLIERDQALGRRRLELTPVPQLVAGAKHLGHLGFRPGRGVGGEGEVM